MVDNRGGACRVAETRTERARLCNSRRRREPAGDARTSARLPLLADREAHTASDDNVLLVTHSGTATSLISEVLGLRPDGPRRFEVRNLALNELKFGREKGVWLLRTLGDVAHLEGIK